MLSRYTVIKSGLLLAMLSALGMAGGRGAVPPADTAVFPFSFRVPAGGSAADAPQVAGVPDAWAGGLNAAHIAVLDLNGDGRDDLLVFDRNGKIPLCFLYDSAMGAAGASGSPYVYAPACAASLPPLREWVQACDYNGDGRVDLFTFNGVAGVSVYRNASGWETDALGGAVYRLRFELQTPRLQAGMYGRYGDLYCTDVDYPALVDVDGDGAVDVLNFWVPSTGDYLHYYRCLFNTSPSPRDISGCR
ncbi:MAG: VCBS repeat-containing protein, partial [Bacteroidales bacterium]|nr:VCBS repeat-containing protein [Bacteroidales bacterium]